MQIPSAVKSATLSFIAAAVSAAVVAGFFVTYKNVKLMPDAKPEVKQVEAAPSVFREKGGVRIMFGENEETPAGYTEAIRDNAYVGE